MCYLKVKALDKETALFPLNFNLKCNMVDHLAETNKSYHFKHNIMSNPRGFLH